MRVITLSRKSDMFEFPRSPVIESCLDLCDVMRCDEIINEKVLLRTIQD